MNIVMMTNTYLPHVGGVARSVDAFTREYRRQGHRVLVVAPEFEGMPEHEPDVIRIPAIQHFNGSDFSVALPVPVGLYDALEAFGPDVVHSHHPFLLGNTALRAARSLGVPLVFTHHTRYEEYTHYVPGDSPLLRRFVIELATRYANLCDLVVAPSRSIERLLRARGVERPIEVIPTGVELQWIERGVGERGRARHRLSPEAFVVGHVSRLAPEKNPRFLARAVARFCAGDEEARFLVVGDGPSREEFESAFGRPGLRERLHMAGVLQGEALADAYHAMDVFAFASRTETQGMVLVEAMAAGCPVVALAAPGAEDVVRDGVNGRLVEREDEGAFARALAAIREAGGEERARLREHALATARELSLPRTAARALACYRALLERHELRQGEPGRGEDDLGDLERLLGLIRAQWELVSGLAGAAARVLGGPPGGRESPSP